MTPSIIIAAAVIIVATVTSWLIGKWEASRIPRRTEKS